MTAPLLPTWSPLPYRLWLSGQPSSLVLTVTKPQLEPILKSQVKNSARGWLSTSGSGGFLGRAGAGLGSMS